jgi:hypothetical protein
MRDMRKHPRAVDVVLAFVALLAAKMALHLLGLRHVLTIVRRWERAGGRLRDPASEWRLISSATDAIALVGAYSPMRARCLEQSLALFAMLHLRRMPVQLRIGVRPFGFRAHAWVTCRGTPIGENDDTLKEYEAFTLA